MTDRQRGMGYVAIGETKNRFVLEKIEKNAGQITFCIEEGKEE